MLTPYYPREDAFREYTTDHAELRAGGRWQFPNFDLVLQFYDSASEAVGGDRRGVSGGAQAPPSFINWSCIRFQ